MYTLKCPDCKNTMKYMPRKSLDKKSKKRCVYCGRTFAVVRQIIK